MTQTMIRFLLTSLAIFTSITFVWFTLVFLLAMTFMWTYANPLSITVAFMGYVFAEPGYTALNLLPEGIVEYICSDYCNIIYPGIGALLYYWIYILITHLIITITWKN